ncbi:hypothetical protein RSAG8_08449, partial [Rhizoctonia solani AG-8 WAC10335]
MNDTVARETVVRWVKLAPTLGDLGVGGQSVLSGNSLAINAMVQSVFFVPLESTANGTSIYTNHTNWYEFFIHAVATSDASAGTPGSITSRLVPRHYYESDPEGLADILIQGGKASSVIIGMTGPLRFAKDHPTAINTTSITPVWYQSPWHLIAFSVVPLLREYAKDGGAYFGESDVSEPDAANAYWGSNYPALLRAKARWDPHNVFQVWHGVGSPTLGNGTQPVCA